ncbi:amidase [Acidisoma sp. C75]
MTLEDGTCEDRLERVLALARAVDPAIFTRFYEASARAEASAADRRAARGESLGPLDGRLVSIKDLFDVAGEPTTAGSAMRRGAAPAERDATVVARLRAAGAVIFGKTNMTEFAFSGLGLNPHYGTPGNARDPSRIPGGSSSGAGVAVALGLGEIAIGSDTGGSVRIPAALNGVVGFKPTSRRIPRAGAFPLSYTLDSIGPLAPSLELCIAADAVMAERPLGPLAARPLTGLSLAVPDAFLAETEPAILAAFTESLGRLEAAGARRVPIDIQDLIAAMRETLAAGPIVLPEVASIHAEALETAPEAFDPRVLARILPGREVLASRYIASLRRREALIADLAARLAAERLWLAMPTVPMEAPPIAAVQAEEPYYRINQLILRNTSFGNFFDLCALSLPMPKDGLPAGFMLMGRPGADAELLGWGLACERALGG